MPNTFFEEFVKFTRHVFASIRNKRKMQTLHCSLSDKNLCHRAITEKLGSEKLASISQVVNNHGLKRNCEVDFQLYSEKIWY